MNAAEGPPAARGAGGDHGHPPGRRARPSSGLQIDLGAVVTQGTLQSGIAYALQRAGEPRRALGARAMRGGQGA